MASNETGKPIGVITIDIFPGGVKKCSFKGEIGHNDVFSSRITITRDYQMYLMDIHNQHKREEKESNRVSAEKSAVTEEKALKVKQEVELKDSKKANTIKVKEARLVELVEKGKTAANDIAREMSKKKIKTLQDELVELKK